MWSRGLRQPPQHFTPLFFLPGSSAGPIKNPRKIMVAFKQPAIFSPRPPSLSVCIPSAKGEKGFLQPTSPRSSPLRLSRTGIRVHPSGGDRQPFAPTATEEGEVSARRFCRPPGSTSQLPSLPLFLRRTFFAPFLGETPLSFPPSKPFPPWCAYTHSPSAKNLFFFVNWKVGRASSA